MQQNNNQKEQLVTYKTLLTKEEYINVCDSNKQIKRDLQTNHYFDTPRFSLKASEAVLRVKESVDKKLMILERKKGYNFVRLETQLTDEEFLELKETGIIKDATIASEIEDLVKTQKLKNYLSFSTFRIYVPFRNSKFSVDKCTYLDTTDYEIEYQSKNAETAKEGFLEILKTYNIAYKKSQPKLKRAYEALKNNTFRK